MTAPPSPATTTSAPGAGTVGRVVVCDELAPEGLATFRAHGIDPEVRIGLGEDELCELVAEGVSALVVRSATRITRRVLEAARDLRVVGRAGVGVDNVDCEAATERGVVVMNTPTGNSTTTAELAIALLLALARHVPRADRTVRGGSWKKSDLLGTEVTGKTLGVVGLGRIGRIVAERALGLRMGVLAHDPYLRNAGPEGLGSTLAPVELVPLDDLLAASDFVSLHLPLVDATRGLISREHLAKAKPGARLINCARGGIVDEAAVVEALESGRLAGAAFDVLETEPPPPNHPLLGRDDVIVTPHLGASSLEAQRRVAEDVAEQVARFLREGVAMNAVNAPAVAPEVLRELAPFLLLAERMGSFLAQLLPGPARKLELTVGGDIARHDPESLRLALLVGVLGTSVEGVNFVNAPVLARERGLRVLESREDESWFHGGHLKARASARAAEASHVVTGTVFGREPRLVRVDGVHLDLEPAGVILLTRHRDQPGVLGQLGSMLGGADVNIRRVELGPPPRDGDGLSLGVLTLDSAPPKELLDAVRALSAVETAQLIQLG